jgi:hypothetical protein
VGVGGFGSKRDCAPELGERRRQIACLTENEAKKIVGLGVAVVEAQRLDEPCARCIQVAAGRCFLGLLVQIVSGARSARRQLPLSGALLLQRRPEAVVAFAQLGINRQRPLERGDRARQIAALAQREPELVLNVRTRRIGGGHAL